MTDAQALPPAHNDEVVEVSLKHVILAFGGLIVGSVIVGTSITLVRDYVKLKRQKALIEAASRLLFLFKEGGSACNEEKMDSLFQTNKSKEPKK
jgi:hypothetical protein